VSTVAPLEYLQIVVYWLIDLIIVITYVVNSKLNYYFSVETLDSVQYGHFLVPLQPT